MNLPKIEKAASDFRNAIEKCLNLLGISFEQFPLGSCGDTVPLLGTYLINLGFGEFMYMDGYFGRHENGTWRTHAWLQKNKLVVDITADQFPFINQRVIVKESSDWHESINGKPSGIADYRKYDKKVINLESMYLQIIENIK